MSFDLATKRRLFVASSKEEELSMSTMSNVVVPFPGFDEFVNMTWHFFIDEPDKNGGRIETYLGDTRVVCGYAELFTGARLKSASVVREGDRWLWEAEGRRGADYGSVDTLAAAVAAAEASMKRAFGH
ncbi:hypothetical protein DY467_17760 [Rhodopseudomonas sp. BR0G17]|nr:hypothetical protein [Rhodopseudomonas sp. BR0G17]